MTTNDSAIVKTAQRLGISGSVTLANYRGCSYVKHEKLFQQQATQMVQPKSPKFSSKFMTEGKFFAAALRGSTQQ
jgi:hypothetical protein